MRDREHGGEGDRFERWEMRGREHGEEDSFDSESMEHGAWRRRQCTKLLRDERQREGRGGGWESENSDLSLG